MNEVRDNHTDAHAAPDDLDRRLCEIIRRHSRPLEPLPTGVEPQLGPLPAIRAVLFDVYGTLFISGSGDVGTTDVDSQPRAFPEVLMAVGLKYHGDGAEGVRILADVIAAHHQRERSRGIEHPEVDIREVWRDVLKRLATEDRIDITESGLEAIDTTILALEYETRTNPTWPMPGALACLHQLRDAGVPMGIVSNAQCFTRLLYPVHLEESLEQLGIRDDWCAWSFEHRQAKPGTFLFETARQAVGKAGIAAHEVLYVGNDMLKDIWPASLLGFRTALFAGDARSYRPRSDDPRVAVITPDLMLTEMAQLPGCLLKVDGVWLMDRGD